MTPEKKRGRRTVLDAERAGAREEPVHRGAVERAGAPQTVSAGEPREQLQVHFLRQPPKCTVADVGSFMEHARLQMMRDESDHLLAHVEAIDRVHVQSIEQADRRRDASLLVIERSDPSVDERRGRRLAKVVADGAEHHREQARSIEVVIRLAGAIDHHQRVNPHVAFGMPFRFLWATDQRMQLGEQLLDHTEIGSERAGLVLAGCAILEAVLRAWPCERLRVADRGLREGILATLMAEDGLYARPRRRRGQGRW